MKILTFPCTNGIHSHIIPPFVLSKRYFSKMSHVNNAFILPENQFINFENLGVQLLKGHNGGDFLTELFAIENSEETLRAIEKYFKFYESLSLEFNPDIVLDDNEPLSTLIAEKYGKPRISIYRTGFFRSIETKFRNPTHVHSMEKVGNNQPNFNCDIFLNKESVFSQNSISYLKSTILKEYIEFIVNHLHPKTKLIPGIPSIEPLPIDIENKESFFYTGPLLMEDNPSKSLKTELENFRQFNSTRKIVFLTTGLVDTSDLFLMISYLLKKGYAVITTVKINKELKNNSACYSNSFLPLNYICTISDLIIHHCGSGMYHYPILNLKPFITIGTQCYDREDVAIKLQNLGVSKHVPSKFDCKDYMDIFKSYIELFEAGLLTDYGSLEKLRKEIYDTMLKFNMEEVLNYTLNG